jgi:predicted dehydrogenase
MSDQPFRIGIIGVGAIAVLSHIPALRSTPRTEITALCRRSEGPLQIAQERLGVQEAYTDWREMLDKAPLDGVIVCTPHDLHTAPTIAALERGLHVLLEKPMALRFQDAWAMVEAARRAERVLMLTYGTRFDGNDRAARQALEEGRIGTVRQVTSVGVGSQRFYWTQDTVPEDWQQFLKNATGLPDAFFGSWVLDGYWRGDPARNGGGSFADGGSHRVDQLLWLGGAPPCDVMAFTESAGLPAECYINVQARLANGVFLSIVSGNIATPFPGVMGGVSTLMITGDGGVLTMDDEGSYWLVSGATREKLAPAGPNTPPALAFLACVLDGEPNLSPAEDGAYAVALAEAAYRSAAEGQVIKLDLP